jgi:hypothetical protein
VTESEPEVRSEPEARLIMSLGGDGDETQEPVRPAAPAPAPGMRTTLHKGNTAMSVC